MAKTYEGRMGAGTVDDPLYADVEDDDGTEFVESVGADCAGAVKAYLLDGGASQLTRIAERLGMVDLTEVSETGADCWPLSLWPRVPEGETGATWDEGDDEEVEPCYASDEGCLAPAGWLGAGGGIIEGTESADGECSVCGEPLCSNCADGDGCCPTCSEEERAR